MGYLQSAGSLEAVVFLGDTHRGASCLSVNVWAESILGLHASSKELLESRRECRVWHLHAALYGNQVV